MERLTQTSRMSTKLPTDGDLMATTLERLLGAREAAEILGLSLRTVFRLARLAREDPDRLPAVRIGARVLFRPEDIQTYIAEHWS